MLRFASLILLVAGCVDPSPELTSEAPLVGVDGSHDQADRSCNVILRNLTLDQHSVQTTWTGTVQVSAAAAQGGLAPSVIYQADSDPTWYQATVTPTSVAAAAGFVSYQVQLVHALPTSQIQVVPYIAMPEGGRLFDHNRNPGDLANYVLVGADYAIWSADNICAPPSGPQRATLTFAADWTEHRDGVLSPGGQATIAYDVSRLDGCRDSQGGNQLWDITAHVRVAPAGEQLDVSVRSGAATITVPSDARQVVMWFESTSATGCHAYDSNLGANYQFDVATPPQWMGNATNLIVRDADDPCDGGSPTSQGFSFDTWARERAAVANLCFEVYQPGVTDRDNPDLWEQLDTSVHWRVGGGAWQVQPVAFDRRAGNNARYKQSWRELDPFRDFHCPGATPTLTTDGQYVQLQLEYYIVVNGGELRPEPGAAFAGNFSDYPTNAWRAANCQ